MEATPTPFEKEAGFRFLFEYASVVIIMINSEGQIIVNNPHTEHVFGYSKRELRGKNIEELIPQKQRKKFTLQWQSHINDHDRTSMSMFRELLGIRKDGSQFPIDMSLGTYMMDGEAFVVSFITDLSDHPRNDRRVEGTFQKEISQLKKALAKEKELSDLKSKFISIASHEFRTPLSTIMSSASLIDKYIEKEYYDKRSKHTKRIRSSVKHLNDLLSDFLSLEKLEEGMVRNTVSSFDLHLFIKELLDEFNSILKKGQTIKLKQNLESESIKLDSKLLRAILINLISNAIKYSPENREIEISVQRSLDKLVIQVKDHGIGIPLKEQKELFNRFFRASNVGSAKGTGLGLNIVKKYLQIMSGNITFQSTPKKGTSFTVNIPLGNDQ